MEFEPKKRGHTTHSDKKTDMVDAIIEIETKNLMDGRGLHVCGRGHLREKLCDLGS